jgi:kynurenine formamidase
LIWIGSSLTQKEYVIMNKVIDLTLTVQEHWRWLVKLYPHATYDDNIFVHQYMDFNLHGFTHVDAPLHYLPNGDSIEKVQMEKFMGEATVVNLSHLGENGAITAADLEEYGRHIKSGDIVLLRTDWPLKCDYLSRDFWGKAPYTERDACEWLVERKVKTVGYDYPPDYVLRQEVLDPQYAYNGEEFTTHHVFFKEGIIVVEYLCNLHLITKDRFQFMALPIPIKGSDGSPVRAIAIEN